MAKGRGIEAYLQSIKTSPGSEVGLMIQAAQEGPGNLVLRCFHSLDSKKCLQTSHLKVTLLPHKALVRIPQTWESGMYKVTLERARRETEAGQEGATSAYWEGIIMVCGAEDVKSVCGFQAPPATLRPLPIPEKPSLGKAAARSLEVVLTPLHNPAVTRYRLLMARGEAESAEFEEVAAFQSSDKQLSHTISGLEPGCVYMFYATVEADHATTESEKCKFTTLCAQPARCSPPEIAVKTKNTIKLRWSPPDSHGMEITAYEVVMGNPDCVVHSGAEASCHVKKLLPGASYTFKVRAFNSIGPSEFSPEIEISTLAGTPDAPLQPTLEQNTGGVMKVSWQPPSRDNGDEIVAYILEHDDGEGGGFVPAFNRMGFECSVSVKPGSHHRFRVKASNSVGASQSSPTLDAIAPKSPPLPPPAPTLSRKAKTTMMPIKWTVPQEAKGSAVATGYRVFWRRDCPSKVEVEEGPHAEAFVRDWVCAAEINDAECRWCNVTGLTPAVRYQFAVSIQSSAGESDKSEPLSASTLPSVPPAPPSPLLLSSSDSSLTVAWIGPDYNHGHDIVCYRLERGLSVHAGSADKLLGKTHGYKDEQTPESEVWDIVYEGPGTETCVSGLEECVEYAFRASCKNLLGWGPSSGISTFQTLSASLVQPLASSRGEFVARGVRGKDRDRGRGRDRGKGARLGTSSSPLVFGNGGHYGEMQKSSSAQCLTSQSGGPFGGKQECDQILTASHKKEQRFQQQKHAQQYQRSNQEHKNQQKAIPLSAGMGGGCSEETSPPTVAPSVTAHDETTHQQAFPTQICSIRGHGSKGRSVLHSMSKRTQEQGRAAYSQPIPRSAAQHGSTLTLQNRGRDLVGVPVASCDSRDGKDALSATPLDLVSATSFDLATRDHIPYTAHRLVRGSSRRFRGRGSKCCKHFTVGFGLGRRTRRGRSLSRQ